MEADFKKTIGICMHLLESTRSYQTYNQGINKELDELRADYQGLQNREIMRDDAEQMA